MRVRLIKLLDVTTTASRSLVNPAALTSSFSTTSHAFKKATQMPARPSLPDSELHHVYLKGSGPGGQKINKTNSACQLTHIPTGIVVKSQATRSRSQNHNIARRILAEKVELLEKGDESRIAIKTAAASKKKASKRKKALRKYRKLGEGKEDDEASEDDVGEDKAWDESGMKAEEAPHNERHDANQIECGSGAEVQAVNQVKKKKPPEMA